MKTNIMDSSFFKMWLEEKGTLTEGSINLYVRGIEMFLKHNPDLEDLEVYNKFLIQMTIKKRCSHMYSVVKAFIDFKVTDNKKKEALHKGLIRPKIRYDLVRERRHLDESKIFDVINDLQTKKHRVIAVIQSLIGVRAGDVLRLKDGSILAEEYEGKEVLRLNVVGKRGKRHVMFIHDEIAKDIILEYITTNPGIEGYYFLEEGKMTGRGGNLDSEWHMVQMNYQWFWADLKQAMQKNNVSKEDFATHDFRRCFARRAWVKYKDIYVLKNLLNHVDPKTTLRYLDQSGLRNVDFLRELQS